MENEYISDITYPSEEEMRTAQLLCCGRVCKECETPAAYALRKREVDLALLLEIAIENELTDKEKKVVQERWYNSLSLSDISRNFGVSPSAVKRTSDRALEKLERVLRYVVFYQRDITEESVVPSSVGRARVIASARKATADKMNLRLKNLRLGKGLSVEAVGKATGITSKRIEEIEKGDMLKTDELIIFSDFFAVTTDYILKGENNV